MDLGPLVQPLTLALAEGLQHAASHSPADAGSSAGAGWWSAMGVRVTRMRSAAVLPLLDAQTMEALILEEVLWRLPLSTIQESVQVWRRFRSSCASRDMVAVAVGRAVRSHVLCTITRFFVSTGSGQPDCSQY
jgi:hypothetical protein